jgi:hypothetical protein
MPPRGSAVATANEKSTGAFGKLISVERVSGFRASRNEHSNGFTVVVPRSPHQCGFAKLTLGGVWIGAGFQQQLQRFRLSVRAAAMITVCPFAG